MKKLMLTIIALTVATVANAGNYIIKFPLEVAQGGTLPNGSINFVSTISNVGGGNGGSETPTEPTNPAPEEPFDFAKYDGVGVFEYSINGNFTVGNPSSFQTPLYRRVALRPYGYHSVWLSGDQMELGNKFSKIVISTQSGTFDCIKAGNAFKTAANYNDGLGYVIETEFTCEVGGGAYDYSNTAVGQEFSISFQ